MFRGKKIRKRQQCERRIEMLTGISAESVRQRVRAGLADAGENRTAEGRVPGSRLRRSVCIAAAVIALVSLSVMAFAGILDFRTLFWEEGAGDVRDTGSLSALETEDVRFIVEDAVSDDSMMYLIYSLESLSEEGKRIVEEEPIWTLMNMMECSYRDSSGEEESENANIGVFCSPLEELNEGDKRYFRVKIPLKGIEKISFCMEEGGQKAEVPMSLNPESIRFELFSDDEAEARISEKEDEVAAESGLAGDGWILKDIVVTKLSLRVTCLVKTGTAGYRLPWIEIVYADGSSQPVAEILGGAYSGDPERSEDGEEKGFYEINDFGTFRQVQNPESIKAVRIAGKEYYPVAE